MAYTSSSEWQQQVEEDIDEEKREYLILAMAYDIIAVAKNEVRNQTNTKRNPTRRELVGFLLFLRLSFRG